MILGTRLLSIMRRLLVDGIAFGNWMVGERANSPVLLGAFGFDVGQFLAQLNDRFVQLMNEMFVMREKFFELHDASLQRYYLRHCEHLSRFSFNAKP